MTRSLVDEDRTAVVRQDDALRADGRYITLDLDGLVQRCRAQNARVAVGYDGLLVDVRSDDVDMLAARDRRQPAVNGNALTVGHECLVLVGNAVEAAIGTLNAVDQNVIILVVAAYRHLARYRDILQVFALGACDDLLHDSRRELRGDRVAYRRRTGLFDRRLAVVDLESLVVLRDSARYGQLVAYGMTRSLVDEDRAGLVRQDDALRADGRYIALDFDSLVQRCRAQNARIALLGLGRIAAPVE